MKFIEINKYFIKKKKKFLSHMPNRKCLEIFS